MSHDRSVFELRMNSGKGIYFGGFVPVQLSGSGVQNDEILSEVGAYRTAPGSSRMLTPAISVVALVSNHG